MGEIRAFTEEYVREAADLNMRAIRGRKEPASPALQQCFRDIFLNNPWVSPEIPSLVYLENARLVGFLGVVPRPMEFRGCPIRVAITTQFIIDREQYRGTAALQLLRKLFQGPQELSWTDGAGEGAQIVWTGAGGRVARLYSLNWTRVFHPLQTARKALGASMLQTASGLLSLPGDALLARLPLGGLRRPHSAFTSKLVSGDELLECIQEIGWRELLKPAYTAPAMRWLFAQAAQASKLGALRLLTMHSPDGSRAGWSVYYARKGEIAYVLQIGVRRRDQFSEVLSALFRDAWEQGACAIRGQMIPCFLTQFTEQHCIFRHPNPSVLVQSRGPELINMIQSGDAAITRLDGECWLPFGSID